MKFIFLFFLIGAASCNFVRDVNTDTYRHTDGFRTTDYKYDFTLTGTKTDSRVRNYHLIRLLNNIFMLNQNVDQREIAKKWSFKDNFDNFLNVKVVKDFLRLYEQGILPRYKVFTVANDRQRDEAVALFHMFFYAKDFNTFYKLACWARDYVNEGMFVYALNVAVLHRTDCRGFILPPPYEVYPYYFLNSDIIQKAMRVKMQGEIINTDAARFNGVYQNGNDVIINYNYTGWVTDTNDETKISYFTEDIGLNTYYYYFNVMYPYWMSGEKYGFDKKVRGEMWYFLHQQLLARYYLERLSNGLGEIPQFTWKKPIRTGYKCNLEFVNSQKCPSRPNFYDLYTEKNYYDLDDIRDSDRIIRDAVRTGFLTVDNGNIINLKNPEDVYHLGNLLQGNKDSAKNKFYTYILLISRTILGGAQRSLNDHDVVPAVLDQFETSLRDPMFYQLYKKYVRYVMTFKKMLPAYTREDLVVPGIKIQNVEVDKLETYFDFFNLDMSNAIYRTKDEFFSNKEGLKFFARQYRLNHVPFTVNMDVLSDKTTTVIVKLFIGPKYDNMNRIIPLHKNRKNFFEIDTFQYNMKTGKNMITRNSRDFTVTIGDWTKTRDMLRSEKDFIDMQARFDFIGFPDRLVLPKGRVGGYPYQLFAMVLPVHVQRDVVRDDTSKDVVVEELYTKEDNCMTRFKLIKQGYYGYPFDRRVYEKDFFVDNMFMKDVMVYHRKTNYHTTTTTTTDDVGYTHDITLTHTDKDDKFMTDKFRTDRDGNNFGNLRI